MGTKHLVFVGTYTEPILFGTGKVLLGKGKGIYIYRFDGDTGEIELLSIAEGIKNPSYFAFGRGNRALYVVNELKKCEGRDSGALSSFSFDPQRIGLRLIDKRFTGGTDPCHVAIDNAGKFVAVANYSSGSVSVFPLRDDGGLGEASAFAQHRGSSIDRARQAGPHAHSIVFAPSNRTLIVPDLGLDTLVAYDFDSTTGTIRRSEERCVASAAGAGPRYLEFHPSGHFAYAVNELASSVSAYSVATENDSLLELQSISTLPPGFAGASAGADLHISPSGDFLYASNRGHDSIAIFGIEKANGLLRPIGYESTKGNTPRSFTIEGNGRFLFAANQDSDSIVVFRIDGATGRLEYTGTTIRVPTPVCIKMITDESAGASVPVIKQAG